MSGNDDIVLLDLNFPEFQSEFFDLEVPELKKVIKTFKKLRKLSWNQVFDDNGLNWEEIVGLPNKYTVRLSQSYRAVVQRNGRFMEFISLHLDHDSAYGKK